MKEDNNKLEEKESEADLLFKNLDSDQKKESESQDEPEDQDDHGEIEEEEEGDSDYKWYAIHTFSGCEKKVMGQLQVILQQKGLSDRLKEVLLPEEDVIEVRDGRKRVTKRKFFPGYLLAKMKMDDNLHHVVKNTPRVSGFLGDSLVPTPLTSDEVASLKAQMRGSLKKPRSKYEYEVGDMIRVTEGPFVNFSGKLDDVNVEKGKVKVMLLIFGRATPVELSFFQIEKV